MGRLPKVSHRFRRVSVCMFWVMSKVPDDCWVPDDPLVLDDPLIRDDRQGGACHSVSGKVLDNR